MCTVRELGAEGAERGRVAPGVTAGMRVLINGLNPCNQGLSFEPLMQKG
jgi:hypothetical protein